MRKPTAQGVWTATIGTESTLIRRHEMNKLLTRGVLILMLTCVVSIPALSYEKAQKDSQKEKSHDSFSCRDDWQNDRLVNHCEIKEQTLPASGNTISVDGRMNGGVSIK